MYCGSCLHSNTLALHLSTLGVDVTLVPLYTPTRTDEKNASTGPGGSIFIGQGECRRAVEELTGGEPIEEPACSPG